MANRCFPRHRVWRRAWHRTVGYAVNSPVVPVMTAAIAAGGAALVAYLDQEATTPVSWKAVLLVGLVAGVGGFLALLAVIWIHNLVRIRRSGNSHPSFHSRVRLVQVPVPTDYTLFANLEYRSGEAPHDVNPMSAFGFLECRVRFPSGCCEVVRSHPGPLAAWDAPLVRIDSPYAATVALKTTELGVYRVAWYGSRLAHDGTRPKRLRFYEILSGDHDLQAPE